MQFPQKSKPMLDHTQRFDVAREADSCVKWLHAQKLEVLAVKNGSGCPVIIIRSSELCSKFEGQVQAYERGPNGAKRYRFVMRFGCEVRWADHSDVCPPRPLSRLKSFLTGRLGAA